MIHTDRQGTGSSVRPREQLKRATSLDFECRSRSGFAAWRGDNICRRSMVKNNRDRDERDTEREMVMSPQNRVPLLFFAFFSCQTLGESEEEQESFLKELPKKCLFLAYEDPYRRELQAMFNVEEPLRPRAQRSVGGIVRLGPGCYRNWQEAAELVDRMVSEDFEGKCMRSPTDPVRRLKYRVEDEKKKKKQRGRGVKVEGRRLMEECRGDGDQEVVEKLP